MLQITGLVAFGLMFQLGILVPQASAVTVSVDCGDDGDGGNGVTITITNIPDLAGWIPSEWKLNNNNNAGCLPTLSGSTASYSFDGSDCDDTVVSEADDLVYRFEIQAEKSGNNPVQQYDHHYVMTCRYRRDGIVQSSFIPIHLLRANDTDTANLDFYLTLHSSVAERNSGSELSGILNLNTDIFVQVGVNHNFFEGLDLRLDRCYTSANSAGTSKPHDLIVNSCIPSGLSGPLGEGNVNYDCSNQFGETEDFDFDAYRYPGQDNGDDVWVICDGLACLTSDVSSLCRSQCAACSAGPPRVRKRRDTGQITNQRFQLTTGPYKFVDAGAGLKDTTKEQEDQPATPTNMILILSVSGVVAIAVVCVIVLIVLRKRRQNIHFTKSSDMALETPAREASETSMKI